MGFKLSQKAIREFRPLFTTDKGQVRRDPTLERVLEHVADRTFQVDTETDPVRESGATISNSGLADQLGHTRETIIEKVNLLIEMGVLIVEGKTPRGGKQLGVDLSKMDLLNSTPHLSDDGTATCRASGHKHIPIDPLDPSSPLVHNSSECADEEEASENSAGDREGEEIHNLFTDQETVLGHNPTDLHGQIDSLLIDPSLLEARTLSVDHIEAESATPEEAAARHLAALGLPWTPHPAAYLAMKYQAQDIQVDLVLTTYVAWCRDKDQRPTMSGWMSWVEKRQAAETARQKEMAEKAALEQRRSKSWVSKLGGDY